MAQGGREGVPIRGVSRPALSKLSRVQMWCIPYFYEPARAQGKNASCIECESTRGARGAAYVENHSSVSIVGGAR